MPKPLVWTKIEVNGNAPKARFGHSLIKLERNFILFGGLIMKEDQSGCIPSNEVYSLKFGGKNHQWILNNCTGDLPLARCNHSACEIGKNKMLIFGGFFTSKQRFNDVYILNLKTGSNYQWS